MIDFCQGVTLKRVNPILLDKLLSARNSFNIRRWCRQKDLIHEDEQLLWHDRQQSDPSIEMYAIYAHKGSDFLGVCGLTDIDRHNRNAEFSLYIFEEWQRKGYASKSLKTLFNHGFWNLGLNMIWGESFEQNPARKLFKDIGMTEDGKKRQAYYKHGEFIDSYFYTLTMAEWDKMSYSIKYENN
jgi:RimJ/RimL family protein N-acetyltransferase